MARLLRALVATQLERAKQHRNAKQALSLRRSARTNHGKDGWGICWKAWMVDYALITHDGAPKAAGGRGRMAATTHKLYRALRNVYLHVQKGMSI